MTNIYDWVGFFLFALTMFLLGGALFYTANNGKINIITHVLTICAAISFIGILFAADNSYKYTNALIRDCVSSGYETYLDGNKIDINHIDIYHYSVTIDDENQMIRFATKSR